MAVSALVLIAVCAACTLIQTHASTDKPKVFGVGLSKTGTTSMAKAMDMLGYTTLHTDQSLAPFMHHPTEKADLIGFYDQVDSVWDIPTAVYYRELLEAYPDAKFVLTIRDSEDWYESFETYLQDYLYYKHGCNFPERLKRLHEYVYGSPLPSRDWIQAYKVHNKQVQEFFADRPDQLLTIDIRQPDAWPQLCSFLESDEGPCAELDSNEAPVFPHENNAQDHGIEKTCPDDNLERPEEKNYAYVTLLCDPAIDDQAEYIRMLLVLGENIREFDKEHDIVAMVYGAITDDQRHLLLEENIKVFQVDGVGSDVSFPPPRHPDPQAAACYRAKLNTLQLTMYDKVIFLDGDILLKQDLQDIFTLPGFTGHSGFDSPLNAGFFAVEPSNQAFTDIRDIARSDSFDPEDGWLQVGTFPHWREFGKMSDWTFWCSSTDQGLLYYYYDMVMKTATLYPKALVEEALAHFTGMNKPFMLNPEDLSAVPERLRDAVIHWYELWSRVEERLLGRHEDAGEGDLVNSLTSEASVEKAKTRVHRALGAYWNTKTFSWEFKGKRSYKKKSNWYKDPYGDFKKGKGFDFPKKKRFGERSRGKGGSRSRGKGGSKGSKSSSRSRGKGGSKGGSKGKGGGSKGGGSKGGSKGGGGKGKGKGGGSRRSSSKGSKGRERQLRLGELSG